MREFLKTLAGTGMLLTPLLVATACATDYLGARWPSLERFAAELATYEREWIDPAPPISVDPNIPSWEEARRSDAFRAIAVKLSLPR